MFDKEIQTLRSNFLIHWTGKDIRDANKPKRYVDRLYKTIIEQTIYVNNEDKKIRGLWVNHQIIELEDAENIVIFYWPAVCFTEIKLSDMIKHARRYGFLGFGFTREFVMERYDSPVFYVKGKKETKANDIIQAHFLKLYKHLDDCKNAHSGYKILLSSLISCLIFVKRMSDSNSRREFELFEESEWRIPCDTNITYMKEVFGFQSDLEQSNQGLLKTPISPNKRRGLRKPAFVLPFDQKQLKVLIFPDDATRMLALNEEDDRSKKIVEWLFQDKANLPIITTVEECMQF